MTWLRLRSATESEVNLTDKKIFDFPLMCSKIGAIRASPISCDLCVKASYMPFDFGEPL